jgi:hypothetical protein
VIALHKDRRIVPRWRRVKSRDALVEERPLGTGTLMEYVFRSTVSRIPDQTEAAKLRANLLTGHWTFLFDSEGRFIQ